MTTYTIIKEEPSGAIDAIETKIPEEDVDARVETLKEENKDCVIYKVEENN